MLITFDAPSEGMPLAEGIPLGKSEGQSDKLALTAEQLNVKKLFMVNISHLTAPQLCS